MKCDECKREINIGEEVIQVREGVCGTSGNFVPLDGIKTFCCWDCLAKYLNGDEGMDMPRRIP